MSGTKSNALIDISKIKQLLAGKRAVVFLDYDGTLSPIVEVPDEAFMSESMRDAVRGVASRFPTAIVSGRSKEKVYGFVQLDELFYAGSHGFDISGPIQRPIRCSVADSFRPGLQDLMETLNRDLATIDGAFVEDNKFSLSVHYRKVSPERIVEVESVVDRHVLECTTPLSKNRGKMVFELRPRVDWNKGSAVMWILSELGLDADDVVPFYLGDDVTDEDAFKALLDRPAGGIGILVRKEGDPERPAATLASFTLQDTTEVQTFLETLSDMKDEGDAGGSSGGDAVGSSLWRCTGRESDGARVLDGDESGEVSLHDSDRNDSESVVVLGGGGGAAAATAASSSDDATANILHTGAPPPPSSGGANSSPPRIAHNSQRA